jgi:hypothetical protein
MNFFAHLKRCLPLFSLLLLILCGCKKAEHNTNVTIPNKEFPYSFHKAPFINPKIIQDLSCWISDSGDQVVAINVLQSQNSNRYFCEPKTTDIKGQNPSVYIESATVENGETNVASFGYQLIGKTTFGIYVLQTSDSGGGAGTFNSIMLVKFENDRSIAFDKDNDVVKSGSERLLIKKLGEFALGDRRDGDLKVEGNCILIGKDNGVFAGTRNGGSLSANPKKRIVKIDLE